LTRLLGSAGYRVIAFSSHDDLLASQNWWKAACLVIDVHLGRSSGIELYRHLVADGLRAPAVFITAYDDAATREQALRAGAADYLSKPFHEGQLPAAIERAIAGVEAR